MQNSRRWIGLTGAICGLALASSVWQFWMHVGTSLPAKTAFLLTIVLSVMVRAAWPKSWQRSELGRAWQLLVLSAWTVLLPSLWDGMWRLTTAFGPDVSHSLLGQIVILTVLGLATLGTPLALVAGLSRPGSPPMFGLCLASTAMLAGFGLTPWISPAGCGLLAGLGGLLAFCAELFLWSRRRFETSGQVAMAANSHRPCFSLENAAVMFAVAGGAFVWIAQQRLVRQLVPDSLALMTFEWCVLIAGMSLGGWWSARRSRPRLWTTLVAQSSWVWLCLAAFEIAISVTLWENSTVSQVAVLQSLRMLLVGSVLLPTAVGVGALVGANVSITHCAVLAGSAIVASWLLPSLGLWSLTLLGTSLLLLVACGLWASSRRTRLPTAANGSADQPQSSWRRRLAVGQRGCVLAAVVFGVSAPVWVRYQPAKSAKLLFDGTVFMASRAGVPREHLSVLDEGRALSIIEGDQGTLTVWRFAGSRLHLRENGIPKGTLATDARLAPRFVPDVLPTLLPLVTHERPQSLLLLGLGAGEPIATATMFPLQRIVCIESDRRLAKFLSSQFRASATGSPWLDERTELRACDPVLAVRTLREQFDVIVDSADQPSLSSSAHRFTVEHLQAAASRLADNGLFAIRLQHVDLGPDAIHVLARTMQQVFGECAAVETQPGDLIFLGTNSPLGFVRSGFIERWQRPHVRRVLASLGWDWSTPLRQPMQDQTALTILASRDHAMPNFASRSTWAFRLPNDVMRWDDKLRKVQSELVEGGRFLMAWGGEDASNASVAERLSEWDLSRQIGRRQSDDFWAYRKLVKDHMTRSPRALVQQASHSATDSGLHPDDDRRLRYFRTIGELAKQRPLSEADLDRLRRFEHPFDPLVTPFMHQEIVELTARCTQRNAANELHHRLAAIYFANAGDRSVRNVADTLQFLTANPEVIADRAERFDHLNSLLQMLLARWMARGEFRPTSSRIALNDIERSVAATEAALAALDQLASDECVSKSEWEARRQYLERRLVRPLRTYRSQVLQHYVKNERMKEVRESLSAPSESTTDD